MTIKDTGKTLEKVIDTGKTLEEVDPSELAKRLGARIIDIPEITSDEIEKNNYVQLGSPVAVSNLDKGSIYYFGSRMLTQHGLSLDHVVGYVVNSPSSSEDDLTAGNRLIAIVKYYGRK